MIELIIILTALPVTIALTISAYRYGVYVGKKMVVDALNIPDGYEISSISFRKKNGSGK